MADLAHIVLLLAFVVALYTAVTSAVPVLRGYRFPGISASRGVIAVFVLYSLAMEIMVHALLNDDFSIATVAEHSNRGLPVIYKFAALYSGKAGSLMLWGWLISLMTVILMLTKSALYRNLMPYCIGILTALQAFFLFLIVVVENVFEETSVTPADGLGMNPLLQNPGMLFHPLLLFMGFAGFAVVFAFTMGALVSRAPSGEWIEGVRRWTLFTWCALGLGNLVGAWWAYVELGWGGYWAWDPVENAGLMPWLLGTAFLHSIALQRKKSYLKKWSIILAVLAFVFTILSPFITHGGIESPLHGFNDSPFPPYLLALMIVTMAGSIVLMATRRNLLRDEESPQSLISTEGAYLLTNIILGLIVAVILIGTVLPGIADDMGHGFSLDRDFFDRSAGPLLLILVFFIGICPVLGWRKSTPSLIKRNILYPAVISSIAATIIFITGIGNWYGVAALVCGFSLLTILQELIRGTASRHRTQGVNYAWAFCSLIWGNRPRYGGFIVHIGIILITLGVIGSSFYDKEKTVALGPGESTSISGYTLVYNDLIQQQSQRKLVTKADVSIFRGDEKVATLYPENNFWFGYNTRSAEAAIRTTPADDLFISLVDYAPSGERVTLRILVNPLTVWMWIGGGVLLLGVIVAFWPGRRPPARSDMA